MIIGGTTIVKLLFERNRNALIIVYGDYNSTRINSGARKVDPRAILTERELIIFILLAEGRTVKEVGEMLGVTEKRIGNRAVTIRRKLSIPRNQFTTFAQEHYLFVQAPVRPTRLYSRF